MLKVWSLGGVARSLGHRNYRLFFSGQSVSLIGTWMQRVAVAWLVYRLTDSAFLLGLVGFAGQIPAFLLAPFAGVLADRYNRHRILVLAQTFSMIQAVLLSFLVWFELIQVWHVIALSIALGAINAFEMPTRQSFLVEMIEDKKDLSNAIALNSAMVNVARLLGPSLAGLLIAALGEVTCFVVNAGSYLPVIVSLLMMRIKPGKSGAVRSKVLSELADGIRYAAGFAPIRDVLLTFALVNLVGIPYIVLMPVFARDLLNGGADVMGFLMGFTGLGALGSAVYLAQRKSVLGLGKKIPMAMIVFGASLGLFALSRNLYVSYGLMLLTGFGQMTVMASSNTLLQTIVDDDKRGRVMSFYIMAFMGAAPVGSLIAGAVAARIGASWAVGIGGLICIAGALAFYCRLPQIRQAARPVYVRLGIIPEGTSATMSIQGAVQTPSDENHPPDTV